MRLIDADALMKGLRELLYTDENPSTQLTEAGQAIHNAAIALAASEVTDAPTIDAAPVVHARFKRFFHDVLGWHWPDYTTGVWNDGCNFCAKCKQCGENIMQDSQGNWFTYEGGVET